jgi:hypothetical protein
MADTTFGASDVPVLAYNFDQWLSPHKGRVVIPEPSSEAVTEYLSGFVAALDRAFNTFKPEAEPKEGDEGYPETVEARDDRIARNLAGEALQSAKLREERCRLIAKLCQDTPSEADLLALPHRVGRAFESYLQRMLNPEI